MPTQLAHRTPASLAEGEIRPALLALSLLGEEKREHAAGTLAAVPGYLESVYRIETTKPLQRSTRYQFVVYERHEPEPRVRMSKVFSFDTKSEPGALDAELVTLWKGPVSYRRKHLKHSRYEWNEEGLLVTRLGRGPPILHVDFMASVSPFATPLFSEILFPSAAGTVFEGFTCGCGRSLHEDDDAKEGVAWMRMTALGTDGQRGAAYWVRVKNGQMESFPASDVWRHAALSGSLRYGLPAAVLLLVVWGVYRRRRLLASARH